MSDASGAPSGGPPEGSGGSAKETIDGVTAKTRSYSPGLFGVIILCFLLPFVSLTCAGQRLFTLNGLDLVTGTTVTIDEEVRESLDPFGGAGDAGSIFDEPGASPDVDLPLGSEEEEEKVDANLFAIVALVAAGAGLALVLMTRDRRRNLAGAIAALVAFISLLILKFDVEGDAGGGADEIAGFEWRFGYWIAFLLSLALATVHGLALRSPPAPDNPPPQP